MGLNGLRYEVQFSIYTGHKIDQESRTFITEANSYSDAIRKFLLWANNGEEKIDKSRYETEPRKKRVIQFEQNPVTEDCIISIVKWNY